MVRSYIVDKLAPRIQGDGGWVEFVSMDGSEVTLIFRGECSKCAILDRCADWISQKIKNDLGLEVRINAVRRKPFFWDS